MIRILKASAGSGKTFQLAKTYISLLLQSDDRNAYRHILAVTFTNKATAEMKNRILKELDILARDPAESDYYEDFAREFGGAEALQRRSADLLRRILHDYGAFSVSTIDKFFQMTLKAFAREIGQFSSYQVELDKDSLVQESVDRILDSLDEDRPQLLKWLTDSVMDQLRENGRFNLEGNLVTMAGRLKSDAHRDAVESAGLDESVIYSQEYLEGVRKACRSQTCPGRACRCRRTSRRKQPALPCVAREICRQARFCRPAERYLLHQGRRPRPVVCQGQGLEIPSVAPWRPRPCPG